MDFGLTWRDAAIAFADVLPPIELIRATTNDCPSPEISGRIQVNPHLSGTALTSDPNPALRTTKRIEAPPKSLRMAYRRPAEPFKNI